MTRCCRMCINAACLTGWECVVLLLQVSVGVEGTGVRCGVAYIGCLWPLHPTEEKALRAASTLQKTLGELQ